MSHFDYICEDIFEHRKKNIILQGPPGVGKSFLAKKIAYLLMGVIDSRRVEMIQFHQSYAYEDFIQGWRPAEGGGFQLENGIFYSFCQAAQADLQQHPGEDRPWVFIIDEINRGNLSKIFGELMLLVEADKRSELEKEGWTNQIPLTYSQQREQRFGIPSNVHLIGLMNTSDRSLAMVDYALRRRFAFHSIPPAFSQPAFLNHLLNAGLSQRMSQHIVQSMSSLNEYILNDRQRLGAGFEIGHSYFCNSVPDDVSEVEWLTDIVEYEILPLLSEYYYDSPDLVEERIALLLDFRSQ